MLQAKITFFITGCLLVTGIVHAQPALTLKQALQTAKTNNPVLKSAHFNIDIVQADVVTAKLRPNPILNNQSLQLVKGNAYAPGTKWYNGENRQVWWQLTKPFQWPAQRRYKIDAANQNVKLNENLYAETERNLFQDVALKWLDVWTAQKQLDIIKIAKDNIDTLVNANKIRLRNEVITQTDMMRTELLANQYSLQIKSAQQLYDNEIKNLQFLLGIHKLTTIDATDNVSFTSNTLLDSMLQQAAQNRSDIVTVKSTISAADANIQLQKSMAKPVPELGIIYNPQNTVPYMGIFATIEIPIFSRNQGEIKKSQMLKLQAQQSYKALQQQITAELTTAYNSYQLQKRQLEKFKDIRSQALQILDNVKYAYLHGGTTIIDFLEAQRSWLDTEQQYYQSLAEYKQSYIKLLYASGLINELAQ